MSLSHVLVSSQLLDIFQHKSFISSFHLSIILYYCSPHGNFQKCAAMTAAAVSAPYKQKWLWAKCLISQWKDLGCLLCVEAQLNSTMSKEGFCARVISCRSIPIHLSQVSLQVQDKRKEGRGCIGCQPRKNQTLRRKTPHNLLATL